jgi:acetyl-CoA/propionyl-CoA carboxylase, biotin carboxylase, biotin carboxyl carrier protein
VGCSRSGARVISRVLIANRGEIAVRIIRTCRDLGISPVTVHSDLDASSRHVALADESFRLPGTRPVETYLNSVAIIDAALAAGADAIHPGYGFLAESGEFAAAVIEAGLIWVGPPPAAIAALGDKIAARRIAARAGVPVVPGLLDPVETAERITSFGDAHGYPLVVKAAAGGGGRGLKIVHEPDDVSNALESARREARAYFGSDEVYVERYLDSPKHLEVQVLAPKPEDALWLGVRDCSLQRRHQKLIEETPPPRWAERAPEMGAAAIAISQAAGYINAGTVELLVDGDGAFYFLEVNSRLQVEHTVTEEVFGLDLVACQLKIASGEDLGFLQAELTQRGHAIECRINAEDPVTYWPSPGRLARFEPPAGPGVRVDAGFSTGDRVPGEYDSLIAKVITWGADRNEAIRRMRRALNEFTIEGVPTTIPAHLRLLDGDEFRSGTHTTATPTGTSALEAIPSRVSTVHSRLWHPTMAAATPSPPAGSAGEVVAPMQGTILEVRVSRGDAVETGDPLVVLEAMKMETIVAAPLAGKATEVHAITGQPVGSGDLLVVIQ